jgi:hypothetical protein
MRKQTVLGIHFLDSNIVTKMKTKELKHLIFFLNSCTRTYSPPIVNGY